MNQQHHFDLVNLIINAWPHDSAQRRVLLAIAGHASAKSPQTNNLWIAHPGKERIRQLCEYQDRRNVRLVIAQLVRWGVLTKFRVEGEYFDRYVIHPEPLAEHADKQRASASKLSKYLRKLITKAVEFANRHKTTAFKSVKDATAIIAAKLKSKLGYQRSARSIEMELDVAKLQGNNELADKLAAMLAAHPDRQPQQAASVARQELYAAQRASASATTSVSGLMALLKMATARGDTALIESLNSQLALCQQ